MPEALPATSPGSRAPAPAVSAAATLPAATPRVPDYELLRIIGRGSYGDVWLARGITGLYRAVKLVWRDRFADAQPYEREFHGLREFAAISIAESHQLALLHVGRNDAAGFFYYVMELADDLDAGREIDPEHYIPHTLSAAQQSRGRRPAPEVVGLAVELARALSGLHARGLVHRDIKPSNVIFVGGAPKLADIGLVTAATAAHTFVGTEGFVPPEGPGTPAADVFSLGKLLYETATGLDRHAYPRLPADLGTLPDRKELLELNEILIRACDPVAAKRYLDAAALLDDLLLLQAGRSMRRLRATERSLTRAIRIGAVLALIAAVAAGGAFVERRRAEDENTLRRRAEAERDDLARKSLYSAGLARAQRALELGDLGRARQHLQELNPAAHQPDLRGFEWHALWNEAQGDPAIVLREDGPAAERVRFSPDGKLIAVHTADKRVTLWDAATKKIVRHIEGIHRFAGFSSDAQWLVGTDPSLALQRWRTTDGTPDTHTSPGTNRPIAAVGPDRVLCFTDAPAEADAPHVLRIWDFAQRSDVARITISREPDGGRWDFFRAVASADGTVCALALLHGRGSTARWKLQCFDLTALRSIHETLAPQRPMAIGVSSDGALLAAAFNGSAEIQLFDLRIRREIWRRAVGASAANVLAFSPDDTRVLAAGRDGLVRLLDVASGEMRQEFRGHSGEIATADWQPDSATFVSGSSLGQVRLWPMTSHDSRRSADRFWVSSVNQGVVLASPDGRRLVAHRTNNQLDVLDARSLATIASIEAVRPIAFSHADGALLALNARGELVRAEPDGSTTVLLSPFSKPLVGGTSLSHDQRSFAASDQGRIRVCEFPSGRLVREIPPFRDNLEFVQLSLDGQWMATAGGDTQLRIWQVATGALVHVFDAPVVPGPLVFSPDGKWLARGLNGDIALHPVADLAKPLILRTGSARATALVFSPDGSRLFCATPNGFIHVFATDDWREVLTLPALAHKGPADGAISSLSTSADGSVLAAYLAYGGVRVWRTKE